MRCEAPVDPVEFSRRICQDASTVGHGGARARYLNRLTPVGVIVKATEGGIEDGARQVLANHFKLKPKETNDGADSEAADGGAEAKEGETGMSNQPATVSSHIHTLGYVTDKIAYSTQSGLPSATTALSRGTTSSKVLQIWSTSSTR